jgi:hypothetical protein
VTLALERHRGRHVAGVVKKSGGIEWSFGRKRGLEIWALSVLFRAVSDEQQTISGRP